MFECRSRPLSVVFLVGLCLLWGDTVICAQQTDETVSQAVKDAVAAAKAVPTPDYEALQGTDAVKDFTQSVTGNTATVESLYQSGQGLLFAPGRQEADRCASQNDPHCLAVQVVDRGSQQPPSVDPDISGDVIAGRDDVVSNADKWVDVGGNGNSVGNCRPNTQQIVKPLETKTCDIREIFTSTSVTKQCTIDFEDIMTQTSLWACEIVNGKTENKTCSVPVVVKQETTSVLTCFEGKREALSKTCEVIVTPYVEARHQAACVKPKYKSVTRTCTKRLVVVPETTCKVGDVAQTSVTDYGTLTEDGLPGADTLKLSYTCAEGDWVLQLATNSQTGGEADIVFQAGDFDFEATRDVVGGRVTFKGTTTCNRENCISQVSMKVYKGQGTTHIYSGEVFARLAFKRFIKTAEKEQWSQTCTGI